MLNWHEGEAPATFRGRRVGEVWDADGPKVYYALAPDDYDDMRVFADWTQQFDENQLEGISNDYGCAFRIHECFGE